MECIPIMLDTGGIAKTCELAGSSDATDHQGRKDLIHLEVAGYSKNLPDCGAGALHINGPPFVNQRLIGGVLLPKNNAKAVPH
jgi:hypothetical protein